MARSEEHTSELQSLTDISYAVFCLKKKKSQVIDNGVLYLYACNVNTERHKRLASPCLFFFFFNDTATTEIYTSVNTLSLHDALPIYTSSSAEAARGADCSAAVV